jgi:hypothetical protein
MADPVSALGILGAIGGLLNLTAHAIKGLHTLHSSYSGATDTLRLIIDNCLMLDLAVKQLKSWIKSVTAEESAELRLKDLEKALAGFMPAMQRLNNEVNRLLAGTGPADTLGFLQSIKFMWKEDRMVGLLNEVRWQALALNSIINATHL